MYGSSIIVSSSYRDLLGTADRIIHLDERMQETEKLLGDVSLQCNLDIIDQKARHLAGLQEQTAQQSSSCKPDVLGSSKLMLRCDRIRWSPSYSSAFASPEMSRLSSKTVQTRCISPHCCECASCLPAAEQAHWSGRRCASTLGISQRAVDVTETTATEKGGSDTRRSQI